VGTSQFSVFYLGGKRLQFENGPVREQTLESMAFFGPVFHTARNLANAALSTQNMSYAISKMVEKQQIII
jgi:hypothetical protein